MLTQAERKRYAAMTEIDGIKLPRIRVGHRKPEPSDRKSANAKPRRRDPRGWTPEQDARLEKLNNDTAGMRRRLIRITQAMQKVRPGVTKSAITQRIYNLGLNEPRPL